LVNLLVCPKLDETEASVFEKIAHRKLNKQTNTLANAHKIVLALNKGCSAYEALSFCVYKAGKNAPNASTQFPL
jgi:hypothetical protein